MNKNIYFLIAIALVTSGCRPGSSSDDVVTKRPNIVFILTDDQGWGDLSSNNNPMLSTPHIDKMASEGIVFDRFYVSPVCSPTRAEILTGRHSLRGGVYSTGGGGERLDLDEETFVGVFQKAGYATAAFGKWHNGMQYPYHPNARGFNEFYGFASGHWGNYFDPMLEHNGKIVKGEGFIVDDFTNRALNFIEENKDTPFLVYLPYNTPHSPMQVPDAYWSKFANAPLDVDHRYRGNMDLDHARAAYAMVENIDWNVGRIQQKLEDLDLTQNTIVIYLSDNGPNGNRWNDNMRGRKGSTDEGGVRSPLIMQWKGVLHPREIGQIASARDFYPTLLSMAGIDHAPANPIDGIDLKPMLLDGEEWPDRLIVTHWRGRTSVRSQTYRLDYENHLYNMMLDPGQENDIAQDEQSEYQRLLGVKARFESEVVPELPEVDQRTFPLGHEDFAFTQIPARDGTAYGTIVRSNRWPNCSYFTNWTETSDRITWPVEVLNPGVYRVTIYYTAREESVGTQIRLRAGDASVDWTVTEAHDPPATGMEHDRSERIESYVKDFKPAKMGTIRLEKGSTELVLDAPSISGPEAIEFRLMMFEKVE